MPRETREQRAGRKQAQAEMRARQQAAELARALERRQDFDSLHTIHGRSRASSATIRAAEVNILLCQPLYKRDEKTFHRED